MTPQEVFKQYYGYDEFRVGQEDVIQAILSGRDVLGIMPTGAGKSVCYQVPALIMSGITIVISPLISLMVDQVQALNAMGVHAAYINGALTENQITLALSYASAGRYKIVYVAPERLQTQQFLDFADSVDISMVAVDEAHCISQWGQDFRPSYRKITEFVNRFVRRPVVAAFTATATVQVKNDIADILQLQNPYTLVTGFDRPNLYFAVGQSVDKDQYIEEYMEDHSEDSGIIYCSTRKNVDALYERFSAIGMKVGKYHAGMEPEERKASQDDFIYDRIRVIIATNAFGMGIDKSNVRFVIHYNMPQSMENYYQEAGRAGRDGEPSEAILLYEYRDIKIAEFLLEHKEYPEEMSAEDRLSLRKADKKRLLAMEKYCKTTKCLRNYILSYFGEHPKTECKNCGTCNHRFIEVKHPRYSQNGCFYDDNRGKMSESRCGRGNVGSKYSSRQYNADWGDIERASASSFGSSVSSFGAETGSWEHDRSGLMFSKERQNYRNRTGRLDGKGQLLFGKLRELRLQIAQEEGIPPYQIFPDKTLTDMCRKMPATKEEMLAVSGMTEYKFESYGWRFLAMLQ